MTTSRRKPMRTADEIIRDHRRFEETVRRVVAIVVWLLAIVGLVVVLSR